jgi:hypothetical protein
MLFHTMTVGNDSSFGTATCYELEGQGILSRLGMIFPAPVQTFPGAYQSSCTLDTVSLSRG